MLMVVFTADIGSTLFFLLNDKYPKFAPMISVITSRPISYFVINVLVGNKSSAGQIGGAPEVVIVENKTKL